MIRQRTLRQVGGSVMVALSPHMLRHLGARAGDDVCIIDVDGGVLISRYTPQMEQAHTTLEWAHRRMTQGLRRMATPPAERP